jgi:hypothetical protein
MVVAGGYTMARWAGDTYEDEDEDEDSLIVWL